MDTRLTDSGKLRARIAELRTELRQAQARVRGVRGTARAGTKWRALTAKPEAHAATKPAVEDSAESRSNRQHQARTRMIAEQNHQDLHELFSILAHDLKHPVVGIQGLLSLIKTDCLDKLDSDSRQNLEMSLAECRRMCQMLDQLGLLGRIEGLKSTPQRVELSRFLRDCLKAFQARSQAQGVTIRLTAPPRRILIPRAHVEQALAVLLDNALNYGAPNPESAIEVTGAVEGGSCRIVVTDHGPGIDPRFHQRVFELFRRLARDDKIPGAGVGLTAARRLMRSIDGSVELQSVPGQGASFTLCFPLESPGPV
jgi:signal transduction histidine kinase